VEADFYQAPGAPPIGTSYIPGGNDPTGKYWIPFFYTENLPYFLWAPHFSISKTSIVAFSFRQKLKYRT
jgi:hypothetical protein